MAASTWANPGRIFISYRREDSEYLAGWLYERLCADFGSDSVFKDVDSIDPGDDYLRVIEEAVGSCQVLLALIGDSWLKITDETGNRRLDAPNDFVRLEIEAALHRDVRVIPILAGRARLPSSEQLPDSLQGLVRRQAIELSPNRFEPDVARLIRIIDKTLAAVGEGTTLSEVRRQRDIDGSSSKAESAAAEGDGDTARAAKRRSMPVDEPRTHNLKLRDLLRHLMSRRPQAPRRSYVKLAYALVGIAILAVVGIGVRTLVFAPDERPIEADLEVGIPVSHPPCDGTRIIVLSNATKPGSYAKEITNALKAYPGASYLRTDQSCPSLRQEDADGNVIYTVYKVAGETTAELCAALRPLRAAISDVNKKPYGKVLDTTSNPSDIIDCEG
jgi:hypothetical protein